MTQGGTLLYRDERDVPPLVIRAVELAERTGFELSCHPANGRLLAVLAGGRSGGLVGETGAGCGVGLAWMVSAASPDTRPRAWLAPGGALDDPHRPNLDALVRVLHGWMQRDLVRRRCGRRP